jgi:uncharacterized membrane protein HdeD (DUF308 family)
MSIRTIFFAYMGVVGLAAGAIIVAFPNVTEHWLKPYFWILIAVGIFDGTLFLIHRSGPMNMLAMNARLIGFILGAVLMAAIPTVTGTQASFF